MLSVQITDIKDCMYKLLSQDIFDRFCLVEAGIRMGITYLLDGHKNSDFYDPDPEEAGTDNEEYCLWKDVRPLIYQIIRGKRQPISFKIILAFPKKSINYYIRESRCSFRAEDVEGIYLNILFEPGNLRITTGISCRVFSMDRSLEQCVDDHVKAFLVSKGIG
jgi:hypothetical protein